MKFMVLVHPGEMESYEAGQMPEDKMLLKMGKFNEELVDAGVMLAAEGLHPSSDSVRIKFSGNDKSITEGPFKATNDFVGGYWLWQVASMEEAIQWAKAEGHAPLVARVRHLNDKKKPDHWRSA